MRKRPSAHAQKTANFQLLMVIFCRIWLGWVVLGDVSHVDALKTFCACAERSFRLLGGDGGQILSNLITFSSVGFFYERLMTCLNKKQKTVGKCLAANCQILRNLAISN